MRLIDADKLIKAGWHLERSGRSNRTLGVMSIADVPTAFDIDELKDYINLCEKHCWTTRPLTLVKKYIRGDEVKMRNKITPSDAILTIECIALGILERMATEDLTDHQRSSLKNRLDAIEVAKEALQKQIEE